MDRTLAKSVKIIYILYLVGILVGITAIVGVVMAYIYRSDADPWLQSHLQFQIRTFWIGLGLSLLGSLLAAVIIGYLILLFTLVWMVVRCAKGLQYVQAGQPYPTPLAWGF